MRKFLLAAIALLLAANGLAMLGWPQDWYFALPTVRFTGPFNAHFVRDIGCAYLTSAAGLLWFAAAPQAGRSAALIGIAFLLAHAATHVWDVAAGRCTVAHFYQDFAGVFVLPLLALVIVMWNAPASSSKPLTA